MFPPSLNHGFLRHTLAYYQCKAYRALCGLPKNQLKGSQVLYLCLS